MTDPTMEDIRNVVESIAKRSNDDLFSMSQEEMTKYAWRFDYHLQRNFSPEWRLYAFHKALKTYERLARCWEEHHNGTCCVVERVRDTYLMPKVKEYVELHG